jgi:hypothetical protein
MRTSRFAPDCSVFGRRVARGMPPHMGYAAWLLVIAAGAIVRYAIADTIEGVDMALIGLILIVVGVVGFFVSLIAWASRRNDYDARDPYPPAP